MKEIFQVPKSNEILVKETKKYYTSKLALLVIRAINDYNYNMNEVDITNQLREEYSIQQIITRY